MINVKIPLTPQKQKNHCIDKVNKSNYSKCIDLVTANDEKVTKFHDYRKFDLIKLLNPLSNFKIRSSLLKSDSFLTYKIAILILKRSNLVLS